MPVGNQLDMRLDKTGRLQNSVTIKKIRLGELDIKKPNDVKGVKSKIIFDAVQLENWIVPILHITIGIGNGILKHCLDWIDVRVEFLHKEVTTTRETMLCYQVELDDYSHDTYKEWMHDGGAQLATLLFEKTGVSKLKAKRDKHNAFVLLVEDWKEAKAYMELLEVRVKVLQAKKQVHVDKQDESSEEEDCRVKGESKRKRATTWRWPNKANLEEDRGHIEDVQDRPGGPSWWRLGGRRLSVAYESCKSHFR
jgi:hypothetical protein